MKKLVFAFAAMVAVSFAACNNGNKTEQVVDTEEAIEEVTDSVAIDSVATDSVAADSVAAE